MSSISALLLIVSFAALIGLTSWGFIGAKMQVKPWRMLALGLAVTVLGAMQQFQLSLPSPVINNHPEAANLVLQMREMLSVAISVLLSMGGALIGSSVSLRAARLHAEESHGIQVSLEDAELDIKDLEARIASTPKSSKEDRDWLVDELIRATEHRRKLEREAEDLGLFLKKSLRRNVGRASS